MNLLYLIYSQLDPKWQYLRLGDLIGLILAIFTERIGAWFYVLLSLLFAVPLYIRTQSIIYVAVTWLIYYSVCAVMLPIEVAYVSYIFIGLSCFALLYKTFRSER